MIDRSRFSGSSNKQMKDQLKRGDDLSPQRRVDYHTIKEGINIMRIAPAHDQAHSAYEIFKHVSMMCDVPVFNDGKDTGKTEEKLKRIFISNGHGGPQTDVVELYIKFAKDQVFDTVSDKKDREKALAPINGYRNKEGKWVWGILPMINYVCYAWREESGKHALGRLELSQMLIRQMDKLNIDEESNQPMEVDIFSDPNEGVSAIITYDPKAKTSAEKYTVKARSIKKGQGYAEFMEQERVTDEQLEELSVKEPLYEMFVDVYRQEDFDFALNGLRKFDEKYGYGIFENDEFMSQVNDIQTELDEILSKREKKESKAATSTNTDKVATPKPKVPVSTATGWASKSVKVMQAFLVAYASENYGEDVVIPPELTKEELISWCEKAEAGLPLPFPEIGESEQEAEVSSDEDIDAEIKALMNKHKKISK